MRIADVSNPYHNLMTVIVRPGTMVTKIVISGVIADPHSRDCDK